MPKVSTSVGDRKALHNDGNGTALTAHVVAEAGDRESEMCVLFGRITLKGIPCVSRPVSL